jgi:hypothetical protein
VLMRLTNVLKKIAILTAILASVLVLAQQDKKDTVSTSADHAGNWVSSHVNAPHKVSRYHHRRRRKTHYKKDTVSHAINHAGNWVSHHVNAPHH